MTQKSDKRKVLIVEDCTRTAQSLAEMINYYDVESEIASDGDEAMKLLKDNEYFLIITDTRMPKVSGIALLKIIKKDNPRIPVAVISTSNTMATRGLVTQDRADFYLPKPIKMSDVQELITVTTGLEDR